MDDLHNYSHWPASSLDDLHNYSHWPASFLDDLHDYTHWPASFLDDLHNYSHWPASSLDDLCTYSHWPASKDTLITLCCKIFLQRNVINVSSLVCKQLLCSRSYKSVLAVVHSHCPCNWGNHCIVETTHLFYSACAVLCTVTAHKPKITASRVCYHPND